MTGWAYKICTEDDLKFPVVFGYGKRVSFNFHLRIFKILEYSFRVQASNFASQSRVLATIGVTRGFGDHELSAHSSCIKIKPFLKSQPEVRAHIDKLHTNNLNFKSTPLPRFELLT